MTIAPASLPAATQAGAPAPAEAAAPATGVDQGFGQALAAQAAVAVPAIPGAKAGGPVAVSRPGEASASPAKLLDGGSLTALAAAPAAPLPGTAAIAPAAAVAPEDVVPDEPTGDEPAADGQDPGEPGPPDGAAVPIGQDVPAAPAIAPATASASATPASAGGPAPAPPAPVPGGAVATARRGADSRRSEPHGAKAGPADAAPAAAPASFGDRLANVAAAPGRGGELPAQLTQAVDHRTAPAAAIPLPVEPSVSARPGAIGRDMGVEIAQRVAAGGTELTIRLAPEEMGKIQVRLAFDEGGSLRAVVSAERPEALDMLRRDAADLGRALADAGVRSDAQSFHFDSRASTGGGNAWQRQPQAAGATATAPVRTPEIIPYRTLRASGTVDLLA